MSEMTEMVKLITLVCMLLATELLSCIASVGVKSLSASELALDFYRKTQALQLWVMFILHISNS